MDHIVASRTFWTFDFTDFGFDKSAFLTDDSLIKFSGYKTFYYL